MLRVDVQKEFEKKKAKNLKNGNNLYEIIEEIWYKISIDRCLPLFNLYVTDMPAAIKQKDMVTKY